MKSGKMFWGFFLLALGVLLLLTKYGVMHTSFGFVWDVWPLIFVFWGAMVIFRHSFVRPVISALFGIFLALLIFGIIEYGFFEFDGFDDSNGKYSEVYQTNYNPVLKYAQLELNDGAGTISLGKTTDKLVDGKANGAFAEYNFDNSTDDSTAYVNFHLDKRNTNFFRGKFGNHLYISLNPNPIWDMTFNVGASKGKMDLSEYKVKNLDVHTGASNLFLRLGDKFDETNVDVEMGVTELKIDIPKNSGCSVNGDMVMIARSFPGFVKKESNSYETDNFPSAKNKVIINVHGGVSSFTIDRY
jgi:hypothetical protein